MTKANVPPNVPPNVTPNVSDIHTRYGHYYLFTVVLTTVINVISQTKVVLIK